MRSALLKGPNLYTTGKNKSAGCFILPASLYEKEMNLTNLLCKEGEINEKETLAKAYGGGNQHFYAGIYAAA